jgi:hypothetical protein
LTGFNAAGERRPLRRSLVPANDIYEEAGELTVAQLMAKIYKFSPSRRFAMDADLQEEAHMFQRELDRWCGMRSAAGGGRTYGMGVCKRVRKASSPHCARVAVCGACVARLVAVADQQSCSVLD